MQRAFSTHPHPIAGARTTPILIAALLFSLVLALAPAATAQEATPEADATPAATPEATPDEAEVDVLGDVLMSYDFDEIPPAPMTVRLLRITLAPGASVPMHNHPGIEFDLVESGTLTASTDGTAVVNVDGEETEVTEAQSLQAGSWIMYPPGVGMNLANESDEDVVLLSAVVLSVGAETESTITYTEGEPTDADFEGVSFVVLGDGLIQQFPDGPASIIVDQVSVSAGEAVPGFTGAALLSKVAGDFGFAADEGAVQVTRTETPQLQPNAIPGQEFTLANNDAAFFPSGYNAIERPDSDSDLTFLRLLIQPEGQLANGLASVTTIQPDTAGETADVPADEGDGLGIGAIVALTEDGVRIRADATTGSEIIDSFPAGTQFELTDGPVEGEDFTWYAVQGIGDLSDIQGWLVTDFMDVIEPAPADAQQPADEVDETTPEAEEEATEVAEEPEATATPEEAEAEPPADIAVGATVATTEDNVRIRDEGNLAGEIINAYPAGTEFEVVDGPVEADDFTWYQVEVVETGETGWTVVEFLEVVEAASEE